MGRLLFVLVFGLTATFPARAAEPPFFGAIWAVCRVDFSDFELPPNPKKRIADVHRINPAANASTSGAGRDSRARGDALPAADVLASTNGSDAEVGDCSTAASGGVAA